MKNYKLVEMVADKIYANKEYGIRYELEKYEDQIKLEYGPQMFRDLQLKVQENREDEVSEWLKTSGFIKSETVEFHEGFVRSQIKKILKETPNSFQGGKPFGRRSDQDHHDAHNTQNEGKGQDLADKYIAQLRQEFKNLNDEELDEFKKTLATAFDMNESAIDKSKKNYADWKKSVNEDAGMDTPGGNPDYFYDTKPKPTSTSRVYVLMLGNRYRGEMGPAMVFADKAAAEAEAAKEEAEGRDTKAFVQDLRFIK